LITVAEKARPRELVEFMEMAAQKKSGSEEEKEKAFEKIENNYSAQTLLLANRLGSATSLDTRITILGSLVRGGTPTAADRLLATQLAEWSLKMVLERQFGKMACRKDGAMSSVNLDAVAGKNKPVPMDHGWIRGAIQVDTCLGVDAKEIIG
jgi:6-phosphofructokinase 1